MKYASFFQRLVAWTLEGSLMWLVLLAIFSLGVSTVVSFPDLMGLVMTLLVLIVWIPTVFLLYQVYATSHFGGGLGKMLVGVAVLDEKEKTITNLRAFFRYTIGYLVSDMIFFLGYLWVFKSPEKQAWHDMLADTYVVSRGGNLGRTVAVAIVTLFILCLNSYFLFNAFNTLGKNQLMLRQMQNFFQDVKQSSQTSKEAPAPPALDN